MFPLKKLLFFISSSFSGVKIPTSFTFSAAPLQEKSPAVSS